ILPTRQGTCPAQSDTYPAYSAGHLESAVGYDDARCRAIGKRCRIPILPARQGNWKALSETDGLFMPRCSRGFWWASSAG
ncbi:MAG: hypothetical protein ACPGWR_33925, partial [Ardenticatenaceae bacterium]